MDHFEAIEFPGQKFDSKLDMLKHIAKHQDRIITLKQNQIHTGVTKGQLGFVNDTSNNTTVKNQFGAKDGFIYPIISTTKYMDSHRDVHFDGCFKKTVKDQQGKVVYALDHELKFNSVIAWEKNVTMSVKDIDWSLVGKNYPGQTQALIFEIDKDDIELPHVLLAIENKVSSFENSIRMSYVRIKLGVNSEDKDLKGEKKYYDKRINEIANQEKVEETGYFWGVEELKIQKEGSLVVAGGSNDATSIYQANEPLKTEDSPGAPTNQEEENTRNVARRRFMI